jgi:hypothetical protein
MGKTTFGYYVDYVIPQLSHAFNLLSIFTVSVSFVSRIANIDSVSTLEYTFQRIITYPKGAKTTFSPLSL